MRYDAVLFDLDGTLTASAPGIFGSVQHALMQLGYPPLEDSKLPGFVGPPLYESFERIAGLDASQAEQAVAAYREHYEDSGLFRATVYEGIPNLLRQLRAQGVYVALASAKPIALAHRVLEHFGLTRFFDRVVGADPGRRESDKQSLLQDALPARYERAAMVGDRRYDMEAAKALGLDAVGATWGYGTEAELREAGADAVAHTVGEAARYLCGEDAPAPRGFFISIEGLDGCGKTTQMNAVAAHAAARGYAVVTTREPGGAPVSEEIRRLVLDPEKSMCAQTEALLYAAARAEHVRQVIRPALEKGKIVLCDRFVDSSIAYQGGGRELGMEQVMAINAMAVGGTMPDLTLLFLVDARTAFLRRSNATALDRLERAGEAFFQRVYDAYARLAQSGGERFRCIDACRDIDAVTADACAHMDRLLAQR